MKTLALMVMAFVSGYVAGLHDQPKQPPPGYEQRRDAAIRFMCLEDRNWKMSKFFCGGRVKK
jgi:hypothetical protein